MRAWRSDSQPDMRQKGQALLDEIYETHARARSTCMKRKHEKDDGEAVFPGQMLAIGFGSFIIVLQGTPHGSLVSRISRRQMMASLTVLLGEIIRSRKWRISIE